MRFWTVLVLLLGVCVGSQALIVRGGEPVKERPDPRLDKKITLEAREKPISKVLDELTKRTGVALRSGTSAKDWQVRDRKVTVFVKDMPLRTFQKEFAALLHFSWTRHDINGAYTYRLIQTAKSKQEEEALIKKDAADAAKQALENRTKAVEEIDSLLTMTPEAAAKLKETNPWLHLLYSKPAGKSFANLLKQIPAAREALLQGKSVEIEVKTLPPDAQAAAKSFWDNSYEFTEPMRPPDRRDETEPPAFDAETAMISVNSDFADSDDPIEGRVMLGDISCQSGPEESGHDCMLPLFNTSDPAAKEMLPVVSGFFVTGVEPDEKTTDAAEEIAMKAAVAADNAWFQKLPEDDPDLQKDIKLAAGPEWSSLAEALAEISKHTDLQFISDHFNMEDSGMWDGVKDWKLGKLLDEVSLAFGKQVKKTGKLVTFEDHKWYEKRSWEVSEEQLNRWKKAEAAGKIRLDDVAEMAELTEEQIQHSLVGELDWAAGLDIETLRLLRFYNLMTPLQKKQLAGAGLETASLSQSQMAALRELFEDSADIMKLDKSAINRPLLLKVRTSSLESAYVFRLLDPGKANAGGEPSVVFSWAVPVPSPELQNQPSGGAVPPVEEEE